MTGTCIGRISNPAQQGPSVVDLRDGLLHDITARMAPTVRDICAMEDPAGYVATADGPVVAPLADLVQASVGDLSVPHWAMMSICAISKGVRRFCCPRPRTTMLLAHCGPLQTVALSGCSLRAFHKAVVRFEPVQEPIHDNCD